MKPEWIKPFEENVAKEEVYLPGNTSCSLKLEVALKFALDGIGPDFTPVLFVFSMQNYVDPKGIMLNNEAFSAYPEEAELLLSEGIRVFVLAIDEGVKISNTSKTMGRFNGKRVTIVHLYHGYS